MKWIYEIMPKLENFFRWVSPWDTKTFQTAKEALGSPMFPMILKLSRWLAVELQPFLLIFPADCTLSVFLCEKLKQYKIFLHSNISPRHWNTELVSSGVSLNSWGEGVSFALVGHPSSDGITIKIPYGEYVLLHRPALHPIFSYWVG